jgi:5-bromo-4-chloroindolyl phosphate hydrolysis protein
MLLFILLGTVFIVVFSIFILLTPEQIDKPFVIDPVLKSKGEVRLIYRKKLNSKKKSVRALTLVRTGKSYY